MNSYKRFILVIVVLSSTASAQGCEKCGTSGKCCSADEMCLKNANDVETCMKKSEQVSCGRDAGITYYCRRPSSCCGTAETAKCCSEGSKCCSTSISNMCCAKYATCCRTKCCTSSDSNSSFHSALLVPALYAAGGLLGVVIAFRGVVRLLVI